MYSVFQSKETREKLSAAVWELLHGKKQRSVNEVRCYCCFVAVGGGGGVVVVVIVVVGGGGGGGCVVVVVVVVVGIVV